MRERDRIFLAATHKSSQSKKAIGGNPPVGIDQANRMFASILTAQQSSFSRVFGWRERPLADGSYSFVSRES